MFTDEQKKILIAVVERAMLTKKFRTQDQLALALGITQPSVSALLSGRWPPGMTTARAIAALEGKELEALIGRVATEPPATGKAKASAKGPNLSNLEVCVLFYAHSARWSPATIAAARAGLFGEGDVTPDRWPVRLDAIEAALASVVAAAP